MTKIQTSDLTGFALDWVVGQCAYDTKVIVVDGIVYFTSSEGYRTGRCNPSSNPTQAWEIIDRYGISIIRVDDDYVVDSKGFTTSKRIPQWFAECDKWVGHSTTTSYEGEYMEATFMIAEDSGCYGTTSLVAAMRAFVRSKLGKVVDVPDELIS